MAIETQDENEQVMFCREVLDVLLCGLLGQSSSSRSGVRSSQSRSSAAASANKTSKNSSSKSSTNKKLCRLLPQLSASRIRLQPLDRREWKWKRSSIVLERSRSAASQVLLPLCPTLLLLEPPPIRRSIELHKSDRLQSLPVCASPRTFH